MRSKFGLRNRSGFTLVELIVVITILGILLSIAIPRLGGVMGNARDTSLAASKRTVEGAAATFHTQNGSFPSHIGELIPTYLDGNPFAEADDDVTFDGDGRINAAVTLP